MAKRSCSGNAAMVSAWARRTWIASAAGTAPRTSQWGAGPAFGVSMSAPLA